MVLDFLGYVRHLRYMTYLNLEKGHTTEDWIWHYGIERALVRYVGQEDILLEQR